MPLGPAQSASFVWIGGAGVNNKLQHCRSGEQHFRPLLRNDGCVLDFISQDRPLKHDKTGDSKD